MSDPKEPSNSNDNTAADWEGADDIEQDLQDKIKSNMENPESKVEHDEVTATGDLKFQEMGLQRVIERFNQSGGLKKMNDEDWELLRQARQLLADAVSQLEDLEEDNR